MSQEHPLIAEIRHRLSGYGPGLRTVVFFKGCPMECVSCPTPALQSASAQLSYNPVYCTGCRACERACPTGAHSFDENLVHRIRFASCCSCFRCVNACNSGALETCGAPCGAEALAKAVLTGLVSQRRFGGGVTFSGGEPALYPHYTAESANLCRSYGLHTVLHTRGYVPRENLYTAAEGFDLILFELKAWSVALHERMTGVPNVRILSNLRSLCLSGRSVHIRIPVVPGVNDGEHETFGLSGLLVSLPNIARVEFVPFDPLASGNYALIGRKGPLENHKRPDRACMERFAAPFIRRGLNVHILFHPAG